MECIAVDSEYSILKNLHSKNWYKLKIIFRVASNSFVLFGERCELFKGHLDGS